MQTIIPDRQINCRNFKMAQAFDVDGMSEKKSRTDEEMGTNTGRRSELKTQDEKNKTVKFLPET